MSLWGLLQGAALLFLPVAAYFFIYQKNINRALTPSPRRRHPLPAPHAVAALMLAAAAIWAVFSTGRLSSAKDIEAALRRHETWDEGWELMVSAGDHAAAALAWSPDGTDHSFSLYENEGRLLRRYVFRHGGSSTSVDRSVRAFRVEGGELALFSMNALGVQKIVCADGTVFTVHADRPFALVLPDDSAVLYDAAGQPIDLGATGWYEITTKN